MRIEKVAILNEVTERIKGSEYCFILNHGGVDVVEGPDVGARGGNKRGLVGMLLGKACVLLLVGHDLGADHLLLELGVGVKQLLELVSHLCAPCIRRGDVRYAPT